MKTRDDKRRIRDLNREKRERQRQAETRAFLILQAVLAPFVLAVLLFVLAILFFLFV